MARPFTELQKLLEEPPEPPEFPPGVGLIPFEAARHAEQAHQLLNRAYEEGGGQVAPFAPWWDELRLDEEYDPELVFLAGDEQGYVIGIAQCWTSGFVKDLAVAEAHRRHGIGTALLRHVFRVFRDRGAVAVRLKVEIGNPSGAERLYLKLGMAPVDVG